jgi:hypothetical protein
MFRRSAIQRRVEYRRTRDCLARIAPRRLDSGDQSLHSDERKMGEKYPKSEIRAIKLLTPANTMNPILVDPLGGGMSLVAELFPPAGSTNQRKLSTKFERKEHAPKITNHKMAANAPDPRRDSVDITKTPNRTGIQQQNTFVILCGMERGRER